MRPALEALADVNARVTGWNMVAPSPAHLTLSPMYQVLLYVEQIPLLLEVVAIAKWRAIAFTGVNCPPSYGTLVCRSI